MSQAHQDDTFPETTQPTAARQYCIGAQIMDDPAATPENVEHWFKLLAQHDMPLARVFIPRDEPGMARMDGFFRAAEKHGVKITATLGGWPGEETAAWIHNVVERYRLSPALDSWILVNEPGQAPEANPLAMNRFHGWLAAKYVEIAALNLAWRTSYSSFDEINYQESWSGGRLFALPAPFLDWLTFWREHLTWQLAWIAEQIRQVDTNHPTHVNPHALVGNLAANSTDLPAWRGFLDTYGASCHPSWHFNLLARDEYALGVSYVNDLIRQAAGGKPFWITELQGGGNTNSGTHPFSPEAADIAQWLWTSFGAGAERVIFWLLNNRSFGGESGEWSLLDFQNQPSERLAVAARVARVLQNQADFFQNANPIPAPVTILLSLETMTLQERFEKTQPVNTVERGQANRLEARGRNAHVLSALAGYKTLTELGIPVEIDHIHSFDWQGSGRLVILPHLSALTEEHARQLQTFVENGNTALITGLSGAWDPENRFWALASRFPLENLAGATLKEIRTVETGGQVELSDPALKLPASLWIGEIENRDAEAIGWDHGRVTAVRRKAGAGAVVWIPAMIDLGAWQGDGRPLANLLAALCAPITLNLPFRFQQLQPGCVLRVLQNGSSYLTVITNGTNEEQQPVLQIQPGLKPTVIWDEGGAIDRQSRLHLAPRGTLVIRWH